MNFGETDVSPSRDGSDDEDDDDDDESVPTPLTVKWIGRTEYHK